MEQLFPHKNESKNRKPEKGYKQHLNKNRFQDRHDDVFFKALPVRNSQIDEKHYLIHVVVDARMAEEQKGWHEDQRQHQVHLTNQ